MRWFRLGSFISICRTHRFAAALPITRSARSSVLCTSRKLLSARNERVSGRRSDADTGLRLMGMAQHPFVSLSQGDLGADGTFPVYPEKKFVSLLSIFPVRDDYRMNNVVRKAVLLARRPLKEKSCRNTWLRFTCQTTLTRLAWTNRRNAISTCSTRRWRLKE